MPLNWLLADTQLAGDVDSGLSLKDAPRRNLVRLPLRADVPQWRAFAELRGGETPSNEDSLPMIAAAVARADSGDAAAKDALFTALYGELHRLAESHLRRSGGVLTISATTLLHEAYLDLAGRTVAFPDRHRFLGYASRAMRGLVIDYVRQRRAHKRGGELTFTSFQDDHTPREDASVDLERLSGALEELASVDPPLAELVDLKFFCGFSFVEIAAMRNVSERTVQRDWAKARALLHQSLHDDRPEAAPIGPGRP